MTAYASASDPDGDPVTYTWDVAGNAFTGTNGAATFTGSATPGTARASLPTTVSGHYVVAGYVNAMVRTGKGVYVGGEFSRIANRTGSAVVVPTGPCPEPELRAAGADVVLADLTALPLWLAQYVAAQPV